MIEPYDENGESDAENEHEWASVRGQQRQEASKDIIHEHDSVMTMHPWMDENMQGLHNALSGFVNMTTERFIFLDDKLNIVELNRAAYEGLRKSREEAIGLNLLDVAPEIAKTGHKEIYMDVLRTGEPFVEEGRVPGPSGQEMQVIIKAFKVGNGLAILTRDITALREAERGKAEAIAEKAAIMEKMPLAVVVFNMDQTIRDVNPAFVQLTGYGRDEVIGMPVQDLMLEMLEEPALSNCADALPRVFLQHELLSEQTFVKLKRKDGKIRHVLFFSCMLEDKDGIVTGIATSIRDLTELKEAEAELQLKNLALDSAVSAVCICDLDLVVTYVNTSFLNMMGFSHADDVVGRTLQDISYGIARFPDDHRRILEQDPWVGEMMISKNDGSMIPVHAAANTIQDADGKPVAIMASFSDMTDLKKAEAALSDNTQRFDYLFEHARVGMYRTAIGQARLLACNQACADIFETTVSELLQGAGDIQWVDPADQKELRETMMDSGSITDFIREMRTAKGNIKTLSFTCRGYPDSGFAEGTVEEIENNDAD